jgi:hypothetical protein
LRLAHRLDCAQALAANRKAGNVIESSVAKPAIGRKQYAENAFQQGLQGRDEDSTLLGARISSSSS